MRAEIIDHMLNFSFEKTAEEISTACTKKAAAVKAKISEREDRKHSLNYTELRFLGF